MPSITLSVSLGEILLTAACVLGIGLFLRCRSARAGAAAPSQAANHFGIHEHGDLLSKLAIAISLIISRVEIDAEQEDDQSAQLLDSLRETCLAIVESTWLQGLEKAYEESKNRRIAAYERSASVAELRAKIEEEEHRLRAQIEALNGRLEQMVDASQGRYAKASDKLSSLLARVLQ